MSLAGVRLTRPHHNRLLTLITGLIITACALSPQTVTIYPTLQLPSRDVGRGRTIALEVIDARPSQSFGVRGGIYRETSVINPSGEIKVPVRNALATALRNYRFAVALPDVSAPLAMTVTIEDIRYTPSGAPLVNEVRANLALKALCRDGTRQYTGRYTARTSKQVLTAPSAEDNEEIINTVLSKGLESMMTDQGLLDFLRDSERTVLIR
jgi:uncharacterized lipoprotein